MISSTFAQNDRALLSSRIMALKYGPAAHLLPETYKRMVSDWLEEDCPGFDYSGFVVGETAAEAKLLGKSAGIIAGVPFFDEVFRQLDCTVEWHVKEGGTLVPITHCATVKGPVRKILLGERVALNILARCSGIATKSSRVLQLLRSAGYQGTLAGTRKTTPGFRLVEKYGMLIGGCDPHRHDLSAMTMLKDNHIWSSGSISHAVVAARSVCGFSTKIEVECQSSSQALEAIEAGADVVMLDNFQLEEVGPALLRIKEGAQGKAFLIEVSGGLTEENLKEWGGCAVDVISTSSIHQGVRHLDFSLKLVH